MKNVTYNTDPPCFHSSRTLTLIPLAIVYARNVNVLQLGDEIAAGLGSSVQRQRFMLLLISVGLAGSAATRKSA